MSTPNFFQHLSGKAPVAAIAGERIYENRIPQHVKDEPAKMPCVVFKRDGTDRDQTFCGTERLVESRWRFDFKAPEYDDARRLADTVRPELVDFTGLMGGVFVDRVFIEDEFDDIDEDPGLEVVTQIYTVWYLEA